MTRIFAISAAVLAAVAVAVAGYAAFKDDGSKTVVRQVTVTSGIVSSLHRQMTAPNNFTIPDSIQTDAAINHGNSGGPLLDLNARVVGVNAQIKSETGENTGVGFAIPSDTVRSIASRLASGGVVKHAYLGVSIANSSNGEGVVLNEVRPGTPASRAGLQQGDVVTAI